MSHERGSLTAEAAFIAGLSDLTDAFTPVETLPSAHRRRALRKAAGVTQQQAALATGVGLTTWKRWESGEASLGRAKPRRLRKALAVFDWMASLDTAGIGDLQTAA